MTYAFTSESGADRFVEWLANEMSVESQVLSYLHVEIDDTDIPSDPEECGRIDSMAEECGCADVLL